MILYFSGTGNSEYVAKRIGKAIDDEAVNLFDKIKNRDFSEMYSESSWVIVAPTYGWRIPRIVQKWIESTNFTGNKNIYFIMTCGDSIGNANHYLKKLCFKKQMNYHGCIKIIMPENYIAMFPTPTKENALQIIDKAEEIIDSAAFLIKSGSDFPSSDISFTDKINSKIVNNVFYPLFVHAKKFYTTDSCISCGKCVKMCPLSNIKLENGKPIWSDNCTHCMACICRCPVEAIEYGKHSIGLPRYVCSKKA